MSATPSAADARATFGERLFVLMQHLLPQHTLSRLVWRATRSRHAGLKNYLIASFMDHFHPDMSDAQQPLPHAYATFNEFFTRALRAGARPIAADPSVIVAPVDGTISAMGSIDGTELLQAKGHRYSLAALLAGPPTLARRFVDGAFATLYLAPYNYHRIHMPADGTLTAAWYVPGRLFSVNATTTTGVTGLFARNERIVCVFEDGSFSFALVLVGALFVGSMTTHWHGDVTPRTRRPCELKSPAAANLHLPKGAELARFNMGSTVILLLPRGQTDWAAGLTAGSRIQVGQALARRHAS
jgi:phosphatidylserine decarboxylase